MDLGIGFGEVLLILVIALIVWGPGRLPEIARTMGKTMRALKKASFDLTSTISREIDQETEKSMLPDKPQKQTPESSPRTGSTGSRRKEDHPQDQGEAAAPEK